MRKEVKEADLLIDARSDGVAASTVITIETGQLDNNQKSALVTTLTKAAADIMNVPEQVFTVLIKENPPENIGFAGVWLPEKQ